MEKPKHTPGPWTATKTRNNDGDLAINYTDADGDTTPIAWARLIRRDVKRGQAWNAADDERGANARLIAAAPDLLAACKAALDSISDTSGDWRASIEAVTPDLRAAIAKAVQS